MRFNLTFKKGMIVIAKVSGWRDVKLDEIPSLIDPAGISALERQLEVITGYRCHIDEDRSALSQSQKEYNKREEVLRTYDGEKK